MKKFLLLCVLFLSSCSCQPSKKEVAPQSIAPVINLEDSTKMIRVILSENKLGQLLEEHDPKQLEILINNFSPVQMAFETEVLSATVPLVCLYFFKESSQAHDFIKQLQTLAVEYEQQVKFVVINADTLFSIAQAVGVTEFPTVAWVKDRDVFAFMSENITVEGIREQIENNA